MSAATLPGAGSAPLPPLTGPCPKCGSDLRTFTWFPDAGEVGGPPPPQHVRFDPREHLRVTCGACGFVWAAAPLDSAPSAEATPRG